ncbi:hypothetical protein MPTK1_4g22530 [Marchantia polymorpha subsp. ruderalis]|uniref:Uncharacterized protein n=2 Tax=Marchantia polymorpha TaxID=3197 RepID=A0AAF6BCN5_MARPO|nr:hypothetical protein MARPO_0020s0023 [Marchantia polymorpha]BBN09769.1 hypothetical protein Mp_4g22530 [Marchantia polymorpha subsp. ruderalis]|eukprot:PTQ44351.1 hypothetical protein MARPO_0020s0023 [Marchantia polymorpha]
MSASTTGVVRLQSRKRAEMFFVRTDENSCTWQEIDIGLHSPYHRATNFHVENSSEDRPNSEKPGVRAFTSFSAGDNVSPSSRRHECHPIVEPEVHDRLASELHEKWISSCAWEDGEILHSLNFVSKRCATCGLLQPWLTRPFDCSPCMCKFRTSFFSIHGSTMTALDFR